MIKANELRIGNLVNNPKGNGYSVPGFVKVASISSKGINDWQDMGASGYAAFEDLYPIPLTPEILEKCGFVKASFGLAKDGFILFNYRGDLVFKVVDQIVNYRPIKHLQQLQNLYFSLTGEELQINL